MDAGEDDLGAFWPALCLGPVSVAHAGQGCIALPAVRDHDRAWGNVTSQTLTLIEHVMQTVKERACKKQLFRFNKGSYLSLLASD